MTSTSRANSAPDKGRGSRHGRAIVGIASLGLLAAGVCSLAAQAFANEVIATVTGIVSSGADGRSIYPGTSIFGFAPGTDLTGLPYTAVFTLDDMGGVPIGQPPPGCDNGRGSLGLSTPVPTVVLTIAGKSYTFGTAPPASIDSFVRTGNATSPRTSLAFVYEQVSTPASDSWSERVRPVVNLGSLYDCRNWESAFFYDLTSSNDPTSAADLADSKGDFAVTHPRAGLPEQTAGGELSIETVAVSGSYTPACLAAVGNTVSVTLGGVKSSTGGYTSILAEFTPHRGLSLKAAAKVCDVDGFDFRSTIQSVPSPSPYYQLNNPVALTGPFNDPPPGGYTYNNGAAYGTYPFYYDPSTIAGDRYCIRGTRPCLKVEDSKSLYFYDEPADPCLSGGNGTVCSGTTAAPGGAVSFMTQLVGVSSASPGIPIPLPNNQSNPLSNSFNWTSSYNGTSGEVDLLPP